MSMYPKILKRIFDLTISCIILLLLSPVFFLIALVLAIVYKSTPIYTQSRPGVGGKVFTLYKFKTMDNTYDDNGNLLPPTERINPVGRILRNTSLDELPQLINVIQGDMSLIGPRPLRVEYLPYYSEHQLRRHEIRPGITGWAQINGRNRSNWEEKLNNDVWYVDNISVWLDLKIFLLTIVKVIKKNDIDQDSENTMPPFGGIELDS